MAGNRQPSALAAQMGGGGGGVGLHTHVSPGVMLGRLTAASDTDLEHAYNNTAARGGVGTDCMGGGGEMHESTGHALCTPGGFASTKY